MEQRPRRFHKLLASIVLLALVAFFRYLLPNMFSWHRLEIDWPLLFTVGFCRHILPFFLVVAAVWLATSALTD